jgi:phage gpG-like protein
MEPVMTDIGEHVASLVDLTFTDAADPYGSPWLPLKKPRKDGSSKPLNDTGRLKGSITSNASALEAIIGTNVAYGKYHQLGLGSPQRAFLPTQEGGLPESWEREVLDIIHRYLVT